MAKTKHQYAVRLEVEGGRVVKAQLQQVGASGKRSLGRIEDGADKASRGMQRLDRVSRGLNGRIKALGAAMVGVASIGGLKFLIDRSYEAASQLVNTADKIGVGVEALQEYRFAARLVGLDHRTLEMSMQRFTRRVAEAAQGTGEAKMALAQMGIALKDNDGNIRATEDLLMEVAGAFELVQDPAERLRLAFKLFDSEGVALVNVLNKGSDALAETRQRARDLGIVLDEELLRSAEAAGDEMNILGQVISANVNSALLDLAPLLTDASHLFTELASDVGATYEKLKLVAQGDFTLQGLSLRTLNKEIADIEEKLEELNTDYLERGDGWWDSLHKSDIIREVKFNQKILDELYSRRDRLLAKQETEQDNKPPPPPDPETTADMLEKQLRDQRQRANEMQRIEEGLQTQLFDLTHEGADRIYAEYEQLRGKITTLGESEDVDADQVATLLKNALTVRDLRITQFKKQQTKSTKEQVDVNQRLINSLQAEQQALRQTDRERFITQATRRLSKDATTAQREEVEKLAASLFDEQERLEKMDKAMEEVKEQKREGEALTQSLRTAEEAYADEVARLNGLLNAGAISHETFSRAAENAYDDLLSGSDNALAGVRRALRSYFGEAEDAAGRFEAATARALKSSEDAFIEWATTGKVSAGDLFNTIAEEALRMAFRVSIVKPLGGLFENVLGGIGENIFGLDFSLPSPVAHGGGVIGTDALPTRPVAPNIFSHAPRFHGGGVVGDEVPIIAKRGETVFTPGQMQALGSLAAPQVNLKVNIDNRAAGTEARADLRRDSNGQLGLDIVVEQVEDRLSRNVSLGEGMAPVLERRYGLNPARGSIR